MNEQPIEDYLSAQPFCSGRSSHEVGKLEGYNNRLLAVCCGILFVDPTAAKPGPDSTAAEQPC